MSALDARREVLRTRFGWHCAPVQSSRIAVAGQLLEVVHQGLELPLPVDLGLAAQRKPIEPLVSPEVAEHRLDGGKALADPLAPERAVDPRLHRFDPVREGAEGHGTEQRVLHYDTANCGKSTNAGPNPVLYDGWCWTTRERKDHRSTDRQAGPARSIDRIFCTCLVALANSSPAHASAACPGISGT